MSEETTLVAEHMRAELASAPAHGPWSHAQWDPGPAVLSRVGLPITGPRSGP